MRKGYFTPPVLIILAVIIFAVAILIAINTDLVKRIKNEPLPDAEQSIQITDQMADWRTYSNSDVQFKYPQNYEVRDDIEGYLYIYRKDTKVPSVRDDITIRYFLEPDPSDFEDAKKSLISEFEKNPIAKIEVEQGSVKVTVGPYSNDEKNSLYQKIIIKQYEGLFVSIQYGNVDSEQMAFYDKIVSTIKFLD